MQRLKRGIPKMCECGCSGGTCIKCRGGMKLVLGLLVLANVYYLNWAWATFIGAVLVLAGIAKMAKPSCGHCDTCEMPKRKR